MEQRFRLTLVEDHPHMSGHKFGQYISDARIDRLENRVSVYIPWAELPEPPPGVIRMTLSWKDRQND